MPGPQPTLVVGGGISGLALGFHLHQQGIPVTVLEATGSPGGTARTVEHDGFLLETGPNSVLDRDGVVASLAKVLGIRLRDASSSASRRSLVLGGTLRRLPRTPFAFLASNVLPWSAKLRLLLEPFTRRAPVGADETLGDFSRRHFGATVTATLLDGLQTGIWAGDIERLSAASAFPRLAALERTDRSLALGLLRRRAAGTSAATSKLFSVEGGLGALSTGLAQRLGDHLRLNAPAVALERQGNGWAVSTPRGVLQAPRLVLALPPDRAASLLRPLDGGLADGLNAFPSVPVAVVHLGFRPALEVEPEGFGFLVPPGERRNILGVLYVSSAFPFRAPGGGTLLTVLLGGAHRPELVSLDDASLVATARAELLALLGIQRAPTLSEVVRWPFAIPQYNVGHATRVANVLSQSARWPELWLTGAAFHGAGVADCVRASTELASRLVAG